MAAPAGPAAPTTATPAPKARTATSAPATATPTPKAPTATPAPATATLRRRGGLDVLTWPVFDPFDVDVIVTTRHGGVSCGSYASLNLSLHVGDAAENVLENRRRVAAALEADPGDLVFCIQSHGPNVHVVTAADRGRGALTQQDAIPGTDALVTAEPGVALTVMVADCVPIVLYDPVAHVLACVHAGWRGTVARVCEAAVAAMGSLGSAPGNVIAALGPAMPPDRYQVGQDVYRAANEGLGERAAQQVVRPDGTGRWLFNLWTANRIVLRQAGVPEQNTHVAEIPTGSDPGLFFSHREANIEANSKVRSEANIEARSEANIEARSEAHPEARSCGRFAAVARLHAKDIR